MKTHNVNTNCHYLQHINYRTYHKIADDNGGQEEWYAGDVAHVHAVPHGLDPLSAQHSEHDHEAVHEVGEVPARQITIRKAILVICMWRDKYSKQSISCTICVCLCFGNRFSYYSFIFSSLCFCSITKATYRKRVQYCCGSSTQKQC